MAGVAPSPPDIMGMAHRTLHHYAYYPVDFLPRAATQLHRRRYHRQRSCFCCGERCCLLSTLLVWASPPATPPHVCLHLQLSRTCYRWAGHAYTPFLGLGHTSRLCGLTVLSRLGQDLLCLIQVWHQDYLQDQQPGGTLVDTGQPPPPSTHRRHQPVLLSLLSARCGRSCGIQAFARASQTFAHGSMAPLSALPRASPLQTKVGAVALRFPAAYLHRYRFSSASL